MRLHDLAAEAMKRSPLDTLHGRAALRLKIERGAATPEETAAAARELLDEIDRRVGYRMAEFCEDCGKPLDPERLGGPHYCTHCGGRTRPQETEP